MLLRLAMVGMVAALGVTLPSQAKYGQWFDSAQSWASAVLADWDTWKPREGNNNCVLDAGGRTDCPQCQLARGRLAAEQPKPATAAESIPVVTVGHAVLLAASPSVPLRNEPPSQSENRDSVAFEPIVLEGDLFSGVASQLNSMAEATGISPKLSAAVPPEAAPPAPVDTTPTRFEPISASDDVELSVLVELCRVALDTPRPDSSERVAAREPGDVERADDDCFVCSAGDSDQMYSREVVWSKPVPHVTSDSARVDFLALSEMDLDFCSGTPCVLGRYLEDDPTPPPVVARADDSPRGGLVLAPKATTLADLPRDVFGPSPETALADLPRLAFGPPRVAAPRARFGPPRVVALADLPRDVFAAREPSPEAPGEVTRSWSGSIDGRGHAEPRLGHAVKLTRDALYAWMNVLTGPALVDVTSR